MPKYRAMEPIELTAEQADRLFEAVAILHAQREALRAGVSPAELDSYTWTINVDADHAYAV